MENTPNISIEKSIDAPATMDSWDCLMDFIDEQSQLHLSNPKQIYGMRLAGEEILSNMIRETQLHNVIEAGVHIWITSQILREEGKYWFELLLEDNGPAFNPNLEMARDAKTNTPIAERQIGGLGLYLVQHSCDQATYEWAQSHNCYHLKMQVTRP